MTEPRLVGGRYEVGHLLGYGGMAEVHLGRDVRLGRRVALKILRSDLARDPSFQTRFRREAQSAGSLNHPSIVAVYDTGEDVAGNEIVPFIVMEYVEGRTLREILSTESRLEPARAMEIVAEVCAALDFSHRHGIVHRDIKPGNVMITKTGAVKVMDFGIARAVADEAATMTQTASVIGTAQYLSPEQARGETVDARSDVYSTGCLLYELITGSPPFQGDSPVAVAYQHVRESAPVPSSLNPAVPRALDSIVMKALAKNPMNRYQTAGDMRADLQRALADRPIAAEPVLSDAERTQLIAASPPSQRVDGPLSAFDSGDEGGSGKAAAAWAVGVVVLLAILAGTSYLLFKPHSKAKALPTTVSVPNLIGLSSSAVPATLQGKRLVPAVGMPSYVYTCPISTVKVGEVCSQNPLANSSAKADSAVSYKVLTTQANVPVPSIDGLAVADAKKALTAAGLQSKPSTVHDNQPAGTVVAQDPSSGVPVPPNSVVKFSVADGKVMVPDVRKKTAAAARALLNQDNLLSVDTSPTPVSTTDRKLDGKVEDVEPAVGAWISPSMKVTLILYKYVAPAPTCTTTTPPPTPTTTPATSGPSGAPTSTPTTNPFPSTTTPTTTPPSPTLPACTS